MRELILKPEICSFDTFEEFVTEYGVGEGDLIITNEYILNKYEKKDQLQAKIIYQEKYGSGEPSDEMFEAMYRDIADMKACRRVIGIGGGTVLDLSKLFALERCMPVEDLYMKKFPTVKNKKLILIPTTCGTGSEVTNISILAFCKKNTKIGLAVDELYADEAVMIPEFLENLPFSVFATSSVDALIHAVESGLSPKATAYTKMFGDRAMEIILRGYQKIAREGQEARKGLLKDFLIASNFAGIAFGTAGCGPVHALSYPLGGAFHVPHGEANYAIFSGVMRMYEKKGENEALADLKERLGRILGCGKEEAFERLDQLLSCILSKKTLKAYGADKELLAQWSKSVEESQQRLLKNSPMPLMYEDYLEIYGWLYE